jgi:flavin reductase (DIM6/NTAB) family NADH-FMN oxidoreductase RutF
MRAGNPGRPLAGMQVTGMPVRREGKLMFYEPRRRNHGLPHDPFKALVAPRPIGWISSLSKDGVPNLAPYSFFNAFSDRPPIVGFSSVGMKDSATNARDTGEFVANIVTRADTEAMNISSGAYPAGVNEFEKAGLQMEASTLVAPPRIRGVAAALECRLTDIVPMRGADGSPGTYTLILGEVVGIYLDERFLKDGYVDQVAMGHLARLGYMNYSSVESVFSLNRPEV